MKIFKNIKEEHQRLPPLSEISGKLIDIQEDEKSYIKSIKSSTLYRIRVHKDQTFIIIEREPRLLLNLYQYINTNVTVFRTLTDFRVIFEKGGTRSE